MRSLLSISLFSRRDFVAGAAAAVVLAGGCSTWQGLSLRSQSPEEPEAPTSKVTLVGSHAVPFGMFPVVLENVGLITGLKGTGSDPKPGPQRSELLREMQNHGVGAPNSVLATNDTSLVLVRAVIRPAIQKGDRFDIEVRVPSNSETTSLRGGYLLETELKEMAVLESKIAQGNTYGRAQGPVLVDPSADAKTDHVNPGRGRVLGGGVAMKSRPLALVLKPGSQSVFNSARIETAVNKRFYLNEKGVKVGVAKAKTDEYIELKLHPRYKDNVRRFVDVVRAIAISETETERNERLGILERQLADPITASHAALQLEALGKRGLDVLKKGIQSKDPEIRFYAAESLAYLDETQAAAPLGEAARTTPAFRVFALTALSAMNDYASAEQLHALLKVPSAETRYGAFRALWAMNPNDPMIRGEQLSGQFSYHLVEGAEPLMIHVTRSRRPEVVLFGRDQSFATPLSLEAGNRILVTSHKPGEIVVSRFAADEADQKRVVSPRVDDVIRAIVELGGTYPDVVQALQQAKAVGALAGRLEVDALPTGGRAYERHSDATAGDADPAQPAINSPLPDLYHYQGDAGPKSGGTEAVPPGAAKDSSSGDVSQSQEKPGSGKGFFARMLGRGAD
jgi:flagellar basal body P-ring protein FlgI